MADRLARSFDDLAAIDTVSERKIVRVGFADGTGFAFHRDRVSPSNPHGLSGKGARAGRSLRASVSLGR